jgi:hypothetical protein
MNGYGIEDVIKILMALNMDFSIQHTNDFSRLVLPRNNEFVDCELLFNAGTGVIYSIDDLGNEED